MGVTNIKIDCIEVRAMPGGDLFSCIKESLALAMTENRAVILTHNGTRYTCDPAVAVERVIRDVERTSVRAEPARAEGRPQ